ncbi:unnamed protein product [Closterium sp. Naga37s-1]|nr:unnamed protein product [Closterium sp. Naga37s-1]
MPSLASRARSAPYTRLTPSALLSWRLPSAPRRLSLGPAHSSARPHCCVGGSCLPSCFAAGGALASAFLFRTSPSAGGATRASGTRYPPSLLSASADPVSAPCPCVPRAADRGAPVTPAPPRAFLPGARAAQVSATHPSLCHRVRAAVLANARRHRSSRPAPVAYHTGGSRLRAILHGADPSPACATALPSPCHHDAASAPVQLERRRLASLAPGAVSPPRAAFPHG